MAFKQSLFPIKFTTSFIKGAQTCKHSKQHFLIGQTKHSRGSNLVNPYFKFEFDHTINTNFVSFVILSESKIFL
jgi:hypothetical protein